MHIPASRLGVSGHVHIKKIGPDGKVSFESEFQNMVLDNFFTPPDAMIPYIVNLHGITNTIFLGADVQTPPQPADTTLGNEIAYKSDNQMSLGAQLGTLILGATIEDDYLVFRKVMEFLENEANGNLTEVGLGYLSGASRALCFKTLIKDASGTPVAVTKTSEERLIVGYEFRIHRPPVLQISDPFTFNGESFRFASTGFFDKDWITAQVPATQWDFEPLRGVRNGRQKVDFFSQLAGHDTISYSYNSKVMTGPRAGSREMVLPAAAEERLVNPLLTVEAPCSANHHTHVEIMNSATFGGTPAKGAVFSNEWVITETSSCAVMGLIVDATTLIPKSMTLPANHRLKFTTNPGHVPLLSRR